MDIRHWPALLRAAGYAVKETPGWLGRSHGPLRDLNIVWHHDASPVGPSPGALNWMISNWNASSAQIWVDRSGTWWFVGVGVAWHAGRVNDSAFDNFHAVGIETDHTTDEDWPKAQIASLRGGTAVLLKAQGKGSRNLAFHKTICVPRGRKSDPDGLDLGSERRTVDALMAAPNHISTTTEEDDMTPEQASQLAAIHDMLKVTGQPFGYPAATHNAITALQAEVADLRARLAVPGAAYDWLPALNNKMDALVGLTARDESPERVAQAAVDAKEIVDELAKRLGGTDA